MTMCIIGLRIMSYDHVVICPRITSYDHLCNWPKENVV